MADLLFNYAGFDQRCKYVADTTTAKQLNPYQINRRSAVQSYFPIS